MLRETNLVNLLIVSMSMQKKENLTLTDLNSQYFAPVGRALPENQLVNLEHFVIAQSHD